MRNRSENLNAAKTLATIATIGFTGLAAFLWANAAAAAIPASGSKISVWKTATCREGLDNLFLAGSFAMPGSGEKMNLWVGKPRDVAGSVLSSPKVWGLVGKINAEKCEAQCKVIRFERFQKDLKPALMELSCEGTRLKSLRMPLHVQWLREQDGFSAIVRMGSSIYGTEEAPFHVEVNRYTPSQKQVAKLDTLSAQPMEP